MRRNSLAFRLFAAAAVWTLVVLPVTGFVLLSVYRGAVERSFDARLNVYLTALVAGAATRRDIAANPPGLRDPNFKLPFSGWYWQIAPLDDGANLPLLTSESLLDQKIALPSATGVRPDENLLRRAYQAGPEQQRLRVLEREVLLDTDEAPRRRLSVVVAGDSAEINDTVAEFRNLLVIALSLLGLGLVLATFFQVRFGLRPLGAIGRGLTAIRSGEAETLEGDLPAEIEPLQAELNALIQSNRAIVERARTHAGNLAHALKTPLSVIANEAAGKRTAFARKVSKQTAIMGEQIAHHLNRASIAARTGIIASHTPVKPVLKALVRALERIYADRNIGITFSCPEHAIFHGERHDLEEMAGNLLDNACKWALSRVFVSVSASGRCILVTIEDDGPGLPKKAREAAIKRGRRLDESKPGSGLGLSIVADLAHLYQGSFSLENSEKGGLRASLELPGS